MKKQYIINLICHHLIYYEFTSMHSDLNNTTPVKMALTW